MTKLTPLRFDYANALIPEYGISEPMIEGISESLIGVQQEVLKTDLELWSSGAEVPAEKRPLDAGFIELPERILDTYQSDRENSELGRILKTAARMRETVDKVVIIGNGVSCRGARALMESCCQPYFNELSRAARGGRPRIYFAGDHVDNDWSQSLLQFLESDSKGDAPEGNWGIVAISKSGGDLKTAVAFRQFSTALEKKVGSDRLPEFIIPITGAEGTSACLADSIGCTERFEVERFKVPDGVGERFCVFSAVGLLPAAILGIDVVAMLEGAAMMNSQFRTAPLGSNPVLDYVAVNHLLEKERGVSVRVLSVWTKSLEAVRFWYNQLLAESLGKSLGETEQGALPLTGVNSRDLHSRAQQHREGRRNKVINNIVIDVWRQDPLAIGESDRNTDLLNEIADKTLPELMDAALRGTNLAYREDSCPTTNLHLAGSNESTIGQLLQMLMLATVVEGRLIGINPYGQPGIEKYKNYMNQLLREA